jgi:hypothetical protein
LIYNKKIHRKKGKLFLVVDLEAGPSKKETFFPSTKDSSVVGISSTTADNEIFIPSVEELRTSNTVQKTSAKPGIKISGSVKDANTSLLGIIYVFI